MAPKKQGNDPASIVCPIPRKRGPGRPRKGILKLSPNRDVQADRRETRLQKRQSPVKRVKIQVSTSSSSREESARPAARPGTDPGFDYPDDIGLLEIGTAAMMGKVEQRLTRIKRDIGYGYERIDDIEAELVRLQKWVYEMEGFAKAMKKSIGYMGGETRKEESHKGEDEDVDIED